VHRAASRNKEGSKKALCIVVDDDSSVRSVPSVRSVRTVRNVRAVRRANRLTRGLRYSDIGGVQCVLLICGASMLHCTVQCTPCSVAAALHIHIHTQNSKLHGRTVGQMGGQPDGRHSGTCK